MKKKVLITGASGFVGSHLVDIALSQGLEVFAGIRRSSSRRYLQHPSLQFFEVDFGQRDQLMHDLSEFGKTSGGFDYIIQNAGVTRPRKLEEFQKGNSEFTSFLAEAALKTQPKLTKFLYVSSLAALGPSKSADVLLEEDTPAAPMTPYGKSKYAAELSLMDIDSLPYIIVRPTGVYGPRDKNFGKLVSVFQKGWDLRLAPDSQKLSFIQVTDLARATIDLLTSDHTCQVFNISDGQIYSPEDFANLMAKHLEMKPRTIRLPKALLMGISYLLQAFSLLSNSPLHLSPHKMKELTAASWATDISALNEAIGFEARYDLDRGLQDYIRWYLSQQD